MDPVPLSSDPWGFYLRILIPIIIRATPNPNPYKILDPHSPQNPKRVQTKLKGRIPLVAKNLIHIKAKNDYLILIY